MDRTSYYVDTISQEQLNQFPIRTRVFAEKSLKMRSLSLDKLPELLLSKKSRKGCNLTDSQQNGKFAYKISLQFSSFNLFMYIYDIYPSNIGKISRADGAIGRAKRTGVTGWGFDPHAK